MTQPASKVPQKSSPVAQATTAPKAKVIVTAPATVQKTKAPTPPSPKAAGK
jgi:hypothetical protein